MNSIKLLAAVTLFGATAAAVALAQQPQTMRLRGVIDRLDGHTVLAKSAKDEELKLNLPTRSWSSQS